ncbi:MAG: protein-glutamate O-methyltransferase CheR [Phycisphaerales bacterium]
MPVVMSDKQFNDLRKIIYTRSGIHFPDSKKYVLESRLGTRLSELEIDDYDQYISLLSMGPYQTDEFQEMFNKITINETSFFRNEPQLDIFEKQVLPELLEARRATKKLRVWSAACSSGEEPYTLAMIIHRSLGLRLTEWKVEVLGTDISEKVVEYAQEGIYTDYALRTTHNMMKQKYFKQEGSSWHLSETIKSMVNFQIHNLKERLAAKRFGAFDVIFCRNVMIYFDDAMKDGCIQMFSDQLASDGTLFIGHSENIRNAQVFQPLPIPQGFCYRKPAAMLRQAA